MRPSPRFAAVALLLCALLAPAPARAAPSAFVSVGNGYCRDIALTYDTEFSHVTPALAATLEELNVRATFFLVGNAVGAHSGLVQRLAGRHQIANHTFSHPFMAGLSRSEMRRELVLAEEAIAAVTGRTTRPYWRPPYGNWDDEVLQVAGEHGYHYTLYWSMDTRDWQGPSAEVIRERLVSQASPGGIALMHGSPLGTPEGTRLAVNQLRDMGYQFVTVSEILGHDRHLRDFGGDTYTVQPGDSMAWVADCHNLTEARLEAYAGVDDPPVGTVLPIPHTTEVIIRVDGSRVFLPVYPRIREGRALAHVRLAERLGAAVGWDGERVTVTKGDTELVITPGTRTALVDGAPTDMGAAALMESARVLVPVRFLAERLGAGVSWEQSTWTVSIDP